LPASTSQTAPNGVLTFDDVLDEAERKRVYEFLRGAGWAFGWKSNGANDQFSFWHRHFAGTRGGSCQSNSLGHLPGFATISIAASAMALASAGSGSLSRIPTG
jgi:hypothetical protein